jgi:membrane protein DedA with SNARE-associated domain
VHLANEWFDKYGEVSVFVTRMVPGVRAYSSIACGNLQNGSKEVAGYAFLGSLPCNAALAFAGFYLGANWHNITSMYYSVVVAVLLVFVVVIQMRCYDPGESSGRRM